MSAASPAARKSVANSKATRAAVTQPTDTLPPVKSSVFDEQKEQTTEEQQSVVDKTAGETTRPALAFLSASVALIVLLIRSPVSWFVCTELSVRDRFSVLQSRFSHFATDLQQLQASASSADAALLHSLTEQLNTLTQQLQTETTARTTEAQSLQESLTAQLDQLTATLTQPIEAQLASLTTRVITLETQLTQLAATVETDRATVPVLIDGRIADVKADERRAVDEAKRHESERREREQLIVNRLLSIEERVAEERKVERGMWEGKLTALRLEWEEERRLKEREWSEWRERVRVEMAELRQSAEKERQERVETDELIGAAVQKYTSELQDGIRIVASKQK